MWIVNYNPGGLTKGSIKMVGQPVEDIGEPSLGVNSVEFAENAWQNHRNKKDTKISWQFTNEQARIKLKRLYPSILN